MKLKLLSLGVAAALAAPITAQAMDADNGHNLEIYGRFNVELANISSDFDNNGPDNEPRFLTDRDMGRWGIKASEKLGNGMTAYGRFEWQELTDEDEPEKDRAQYVGLKGAWGKFQAGHQDAPYKLTAKWDPLGDTTLEAENGGGMSRGAFGNSGRIENSVLYGTPDINGFSLLALYVPENEDEQGGGDDDLGGALSIGAMYEAGPFEVGVAYSDSGSDGIEYADDHDRIKLGAKYTFGNHTIAATYEQVDGISTEGASSALGGDFSSSSPVIKSGAYEDIYADEADFMWLAYMYKMGNTTLVATWGMEEYEDAASDFGSVAVSSSDIESDVYTLALIHKFSKTTRIYGGWKRWDVDRDDLFDTNGTNLDVAGEDEDVDLFTIGLRKDFKI